MKLYILLILSILAGFGCGQDASFNEKFQNGDSGDGISSEDPNDKLNDGGKSGDSNPTEEEDDDEAYCGDDKPGFVGLVYRLPPQTAKLPHFPDLKAEGMVRSNNLNVPDRNWEKGFPGVEDLQEWFAIDFVTSLEVPETGDYVFRTISDDGAKYYLDGELLLDNDGVHAPKAKNSGTVQVKEGKHRFRVSWFQGPKRQIALQVFWLRPGHVGFENIDLSLIEHKDNCSTVDLGIWP